MKKPCPECGRPAPGTPTNSAAQQALDRVKRISKKLHNHEDLQTAGFIAGFIRAVIASNALPEDRS